MKTKEVQCGILVAFDTLWKVIFVNDFMHKFIALWYGDCDLR